MAFVNLSDQVAVVKYIVDRLVQIGGEPHSGWLPPGASMPLPTPVRDIVLNLEIQFDESGYLFCYDTTDGTFCGDTWHETLADAEEAARSAFGIDSTEWKSLDC